MSAAWDAVSEDVVSHSFKACGISSAMDGSEEQLLTDNVSRALDAHDRAANVRDEAAGLLFDDESDEDDEEFEGFSADEEEEEDAEEDA